MSATTEEFDDELLGTPGLSRRTLVGKIADLVERSGLDPDDIGRLNKINLWQAMSKDEEGNPQVTDLVGIQLSPAWEDGPKWPVIEQAPPSVVKTRKVATAKKLDGFKTAVVLPDIQIGYYWSATGDLVPTHDEAALSIALEITRTANPDRVVLVGDNLDLPELSKYRLSPVFRRTTQATINRAETFAAELRAAAPDAVIEWIAGNHEERLPNYITDNAVAAFGLRRGNVPTEWPVLTVPYLCRLDEHDITFLPGYPANRVWINERLKVVHGDKVSQGSTAHAYLASERVSVVYGHIHRREWAEQTRETHDGPRTIAAISPGCLCRVDGRVPSTKAGVDHDGIPLEVVENWQQGLLVISYVEGDGAFVPELIPIHDGFASWRGRPFSAVS